jgi:hypothetical protein
MTLQPALAAVNGTLYLAWSNSTSPFFGDPAGNSTILFIRSADGGNTWSCPTQVNPSGDDIHMCYPQSPLTTMPTVRGTSRSMNLPPTNIPLAGAPTFAATNYDRQIAVCYALGEYQSVTTANGSVYTAWGDTRNQITEPVDALDPISGQSHPQEDVFFQKVKVQ